MTVWRAIVMTTVSASASASHLKEKTLSWVISFELLGLDADISHI
jgi:hypothetical protein